MCTGDSKVYSRKLALAEETVKNVLYRQSDDSDQPSAKRSKSMASMRIKILKDTCFEQ